jgi:autoinducer 2-degrading protein
MAHTSRSTQYASALELSPGFPYFSFMFIVHVQIRVKPDAVETFKAATLANARASRLEPGIVRFDVVQQADDPTRFVLVEVYRDPAAQLAHRETAHYPVWRDTVANLMAEPRTSVKYANVFPDDANW